MEASIPVIDISPFFRNELNDAAHRAANQIKKACEEHGFFYISGHGVDADLQARLEELSLEFFQLPENEKMKIAMELGGRSWRGYFPVGGELTSGRPDIKEGIYFGTELSSDHPKVKTNTPMHGANLFPEKPKELKAVVLEYMEQVTQAAHAVMRGIALSLGLSADYFHERYTADPLILFRIFHYPPPKQSEDWGVGEHTDYGLLTILKQDSIGGLQVKSQGEWIAAPPIENTFICNIGDMLDRMTGGLYRSTPHRVLNASGKSRLSFPLFFDPGFDTYPKKIEGLEKTDFTDDQQERWDKASVHTFEGTYGNYILGKVAKVFPTLGEDVI